MTTFYTSDIHLGHVNILEYEKRPWYTVEEMNEGIVDLWNKQVNIDDDVIILGDLCMGKLTETLEYVQYLNGHKFLICGNHDRPWMGHPEKRRKGWKEKYLEAGVEDILVPTEPSHHEVGYPDGIFATISHFPYTSIDRHQDRYDAFSPPDKGGWLLHGHVHSAWLQRGREVNVGLDAWGGMIPTEDDILFLIKAGPNNLGAREWSIP